MSRLEKFIEANRDEFDDMEPSAKTWKQVEAGLKKKTGFYYMRTAVMRWSIAASILLLAGIATYLSVNKNIPPNKATASNGDTIVTDLTALAPIEAPEMNQFAKMILLKQEELKILTKEQPALYQKFAKDFYQLDSSYNILKTKLSVTPNRELLIEAMIQNLQLQLNVLNQQLNIIQQIKQSKKYSHEKNTSFI